MTHPLDRQESRKTLRIEALAFGLLFPAIARASLRFATRRVLGASQRCAEHGRGTRPMRSPKRHRTLIQINTRLRSLTTPWWPRSESQQHRHLARSKSEASLRPLAVDRAAVLRRLLPDRDEERVPCSGARAPCVRIRSRVLPQARYDCGRAAPYSRWSLRRRVQTRAGDAVRERVAPHNGAQPCRRTCNDPHRVQPSLVVPAAGRNESRASAVVSSSVGGSS